jgi:hypothetical protein
MRVFARVQLRIQMIHDMVVYDHYLKVRRTMMVQFIEHELFIDEGHKHVVFRDVCVLIEVAIL